MIGFFDALGMEQSVVFEGKTYKLAPPDNFEVVARHGVYLIRSGDAGAALIAKARGPQFVAAYERQLNEAVYAGHFNFLGKVWRESMSNFESQVDLLKCMLEVGNASDREIVVTDDLAKKMYSAKAREIAQRFDQRRPSEGDDDPKVPTDLPTTATT